MVRKAHNPTQAGHLRSKLNMKQAPGRRSKLKKEESRIIIFENGEVGFSNLTSELIDVALKVNPDNQKMLARKSLMEKRVRKNGCKESRRD